MDEYLLLSNFTKITFDPLVYIYKLKHLNKCDKYNKLSCNTYFITFILL